MGNPNSANRARRKDPFRRAVRAPAIRPEPVRCPLGKCEHLAGLHNPAYGHTASGSVIERAVCTACDCEGDL